MSSFPRLHVRIEYQTTLLDAQENEFLPFDGKEGGDIYT
jgi:hypothetical protein